MYPSPPAVASTSMYLSQPAVTTSTSMYPSLPLTTLTYPSLPPYCPSVSPPPIFPQSLEYYPRAPWTNPEFEIKVEREIDDIKKRLDELESSRRDAGDEDQGFSGIPPEKTGAIRVVLNNKSLGWRAALRKVLTVVFSLDVLAKSCAVGKKNAQFEKLNVTLLKSVKGKCNGICMCVCVFTITFSSRTNVQFLLYGTGHEGGGDEQSYQ